MKSDTLEHLYGKDYVITKNGFATSKEYKDPIPLKRTNSVMCVLTTTPRNEYLEYLAYVQTSGTPEPTETYTDWAGFLVLSFKDWLAQKNKETIHRVPIEIETKQTNTKVLRGKQIINTINPRTFKRFGITFPIFFRQPDVVLFVILISTVIAFIMALL